MVKIHPTAYPWRHQICLASQRAASSSKAAVRAWQNIRDGLGLGFDFPMLLDQASNPPNPIESGKHHVTMAPVLPTAPERRGHQLPCRSPWRTLWPRRDPSPEARATRTWTPSTSGSGDVFRLGNLTPPKNARVKKGKNGSEWIQMDLNPALDNSSGSF